MSASGRGVSCKKRSQPAQPREDVGTVVKKARCVASGSRLEEADVLGATGTSFFARQPAPDTRSEGLTGVLSLVSEAALEYQKIVQGLPDALKNEKAAMLSHWREQFPTWRFQLRERFSLLFYGLGSKRALMEAFAREQLTDGGLVVVSAWHQGVATPAKQIAVAAASSLFHEEPAAFRGLSTESVIAKLRECTLDRRVYVVVNNIDAPSLRAPAEQAVLAGLAACACVHVVATVDHVSAPALFDKRASEQFRWLWHHVPTFDAMTAETRGVPPALASYKQDATRRSAVVVLRTLSQSSREVFKVLAQALLDDLDFEDDEEEPEGITYARLFRLCRERFLVSSDVSLKSHLTEFKDHELVKTRRGADGTELLFVPLSAAKLNDLVDELVVAVE